MTLRTSRQGNILVVTLDRASAGNALDVATQGKLVEAWRVLEGDKTLAAAVLHGDGGVFSIGHDREELLSTRDGLAPSLDLFPWSLSKPVIAAIEGCCYGLGFELSLACDLRIVAEGSTLGLPDRNLMVPYRVASVLLPRQTFLGMSLELLLTGRVLDADEAVKARLVTETTPPGMALARAVALAEEITRPGKPGLQKALIWQSTGRPIGDALHLARTAAVIEGGTRL